MMTLREKLHATQLVLDEWARRKDPNITTVDESYLVRIADILEQPEPEPAEGDDTVRQRPAALEEPVITHRLVYVEKASGRVVDIDRIVRATPEGWKVNGAEHPAGGAFAYADRTDAIAEACDLFGLKAMPPCAHHPKRAAQWVCYKPDPVGDMKSPAVHAYLCTTCADDHHHVCAELMEGRAVLKRLEEA